MTTQHPTHRPLYTSLPSIVLRTIALLTLLTSCQPKVSDRQLSNWHQEAVTENDRLTQAQSADLSKNWKLTIEGQVNSPITLTWPQIQTQSIGTFSSRKPYPDSPKTPSTFRGIPVKTLLDQANVQTGATEVTIVAADNYYATMPLKEFVSQQGLVAIEENSKPIRRTDGGPLHLVFNHDAKSDSSGVHNEWVYYVTHLIIGTEPIRLNLNGEKNLTRSDLEQLPSQQITAFVGYKIGWSSEPVKLTGVKLKDILQSQKNEIPTNALLSVHRKAMNSNEPQKTVTFSADLLDSCDVLLAYRWGPNAQNIPASKGGPLALAYGKNCTSDAAKNLAWLPFVESITIDRASAVKP
jgi:DMSO/TMAO reductase YedYZ molybdopterin-dependent catalytic subunit